MISKPFVIYCVIISKLLMVPLKIKFKLAKAERALDENSVKQGSGSIRGALKYLYFFNLCDL